MHATFTRLMTCKLKAEAGRFPVLDLIFDPEARRLHSVLVDVGGLFRRTEALIEMRRLGEIDAAGDWTTSLRPHEVVSAPRIEDGAQGAVPVPDITDWPPMVVGPFATVQSPLMLAAQFFGAGPGRARAALPRRLERWTDWQDALVFGPAGAFAKIADFHVDLDSDRLSGLVLSLDRRKIDCPLEIVRNFVSREGYAVSDMTERDFDAETDRRPWGAGAIIPQAARWLGA